MVFTLAYTSSCLYIKVQTYSGLSREPFVALRSMMARVFFFIFHALSFEFNFFFDRSFLLTNVVKGYSKSNCLCVDARR